MTRNWKDLVRPHIWDLKPYSSARDEYSGEAKVFLDANENPYDDKKSGWNRYPDPYQREIKKQLAAIKAVPEESIFIGNGSDEAIDLLYRIFCEPAKDNVILCPPTYGMYEVSASIHNVETIKVELTEDYQLQVVKILEAQNEYSKLLFICSPNNPTGNVLQKEAIEQLLQGFQGIVVIDEAYIDFSSEASWLTHLNQYDNLVIMQTMSKAWGLAAVRLGMAFTNPELINIFNKVKPPYNISGPNQQVVLETLHNKSQVESEVNKILADREKLATVLQELEVVTRIHPSDANFLLVEVKDAALLYKQLLTKEIVVRDRSKVSLCGNCLRITVGTEEENNKLLESLSNINQVVK
jgi:histidinol-phosphate aminotransferase